MEIFRLGNIKVIPQVFSVRDGMDDPLCLEDLLRNSAVLAVLEKEKIK